MSKRLHVIKVFIGILIGALFLVPQVSYANWSVGVGFGPRYNHRDRDYYEHHYYRWHEHPKEGWRVHYLPYGYRTIWAGGARYYYYDGLYYSWVNGDYCLVSPPYGAYVSVLPSDFQPIMINGRMYYTDNGVYYILTHSHGYKVVPAPVVYAQEVPVVIQPVITQGEFSVNIPNSNGGYTTLIIRRAGNGYVGPRGEYYNQFPSVTQLRNMYGK